MTQPTVPPNDGRVDSHVGTTPSTGPFQIDFPFMNLGEIVVEIAPDGPIVVWTVLVYGSQYTVAATANEDGSYTNGTISLVAAVANTTVRRFRNTQIERLSNYPLTGYFDRLSLNAEMNRYVMCLQDFDRRLVDVGGEPSNPVTPGDYPLVGRVLQTPTGEAPVGVTAGLVATRASKLLAWNASGSLINSSVTLAQTEAVVNAGVPNLAPYALLASPVFTGDPQAPTPTLGDSDQSVATTGFVKAVATLGPLGSAGGDLTGTYPNPVLAPIITAGTVGGPGQTVQVTFDAKGRLTVVASSTITPGSIGAAPIASPALTGNPTAPDPGPTHQTDQTVANTKFVTDAVAAAVGGSTPTGPAGGDLAGSNYPNPLIKSNVTLAGAPTAVTPATADNSTKLATTQFVKAQAYQTIAGMPTIPTTLPPNGPAGGVLAGTYPNPTLLRSALQIYDEQILGVATLEIRVAMPASPKKLELEWNIFNSAAADIALLLQFMNGATPIGGTYATQALQGSGAAGSAAYSSGVGWTLGSARTFSGKVSLRNMGTNWTGNLDEYTIQNTGTVFQYTASLQSDPAVVITGFRLIPASGTGTLGIGSYMRLFAVI